MVFGEEEGDEVERVIKKMNKIDSMFVPKGYPPPPEIDLKDKDQIYLGVQQIS